MARTHPIVRDAVPDDAEALLSIWSDFTSDPPRQPRPSTDVDEVRRAVRRIGEDPLQRLVVAVAEDAPVGVAHLRRAPVSPIHGEDAVHVGYLHVLSMFRRRGLGKQMMETAADWAEELGSQHIVASVAATARESNRFLARLGMSQVAVVRATTVTALKGKLRTPFGETVLPNLVTARRLMRLSASRGPAGR
ncbi:MAG: GNAT family N-acetyltransferase [Actinomycetota bacterium]|jgi:RimJ/RimL family protein N-acetyltransferase|nr:GNAT family N-acetyltransferase [Actinomycetota bacterium]